MLPVDWWVQWSDVKLIREGLRKAFAETCYAVVLENIRKNRQCNPNVFPSSWKQYTTAMRHSSDDVTHRKRKGERPTHVEELLGISSMLNIHPKELPPSIFEWLEIAVLEICEKANIECRGLDSAPFTDYCLTLYRHKLQTKEQFVRLQMWELEECCVSPVYDRYATYFADANELADRLLVVARGIEALGET